MEWYALVTKQMLSLHGRVTILEHCYTRIDGLFTTKADDIILLKGSPINDNLRKIKRKKITDNDEMSCMFKGIGHYPSCRKKGGLRLLWIRSPLLPELQFL